MRRISPRGRAAPPTPPAPTQSGLSRDSSANHRLCCRNQEGGLGTACEAVRSVQAADGTKRQQQLGPVPVVVQSLSSRLSAHCHGAAESVGGALLSGRPAAGRRTTRSIYCVNLSDLNQLFIYCMIIVFSTFSRRKTALSQSQDRMV